MQGHTARRTGARLSMLAVAALAFGQSAAQPESAAITLAEAITLTLARHPELVAHGLAIDAAEGRLLQSRFAPSPELTAFIGDAVGTGQFRGLHAAETTVTLGWVLERGARQRRIDVSRAGVELTRIDAEVARLDAAAETARRFLDCLAFQARLDRAAEGIRLAEAAIAAVRRRVAASRGPAAELARAEAELARSELLHEDYEHELLSAYHRLSAQWGDTEPDFDTAAGSLAALPELEPFAALVARVGANPDIARFVSEERLREAELRLAEARARPAWTISGGVRRFEASDDLALVGSITVPLRLGNRNQGNVAAARASLAQTEADRTAARIRMETELFVLYQRLRHDIQLPERLIADVIPAYEAALTEMQRAFDLGRSSYLDLRSLQTELHAANNEVLEAYIDAHRLVIEIERLTGERVANVPVAQGNQP